MRLVSQRIDVAARAGIVALDPAVVADLPFKELRIEFARSRFIAAADFKIDQWIWHRRQGSNTTGRVKTHTAGCCTPRSRRSRKRRSLLFATSSSARR